MIHDLPIDTRASIDSYSLTALRTMLRWRSDGRPDARNKGECVAALRSYLFEPTSIRRAIASCDALTREALALLRRKGGVMPVAAMCGQIATWHPSLPPTDVRRVPVELVRRALAFWHTASPRYTQNMHDIQRPGGESILSTLVYSPPEILDFAPIPPELGRYTMVPAGPGFPKTTPGQSQRRILAFLRAVEARSPRVLRNGLIGARDRAALGDAVGLGQADDVGPASAGGLLSQRGHPINFLAQTLRAAGLVTIASDSHLRTTPAALQFVALPPQRQARLLLQAWLDSGDNGLLTLTHLHCDRRSSPATSIPDEAQARAAYRRLVDAIRRQVRPGCWYDVTELSRALRHEDVEFLVSWLDPSPYHYWSSYYHEPDVVDAPAYAGITLEDSRGRPRTLMMGADWELVEGAFIRAAVEGPLTWLGLVEGGDLPGTFGLTRVGAQALEVDDSAWGAESNDDMVPSDALIVQPNYDVLVYEPEEHSQLVYQIDRFAESVSHDRVAAFHLTRESLCGGLQLGLRIDDILALLDGASRVPVPQNVVFSLRDWAANFESVRWVRSGALLEAPDAATLDRWLAEPELAATIDRRISPTLAVLLVAEPTSVRRRLRALGVDVGIVDANSPLRQCAERAGETSFSVDANEANLFSLAAIERLADETPERRPGTAYTITRQSIQRANAAGLAAERILEILDAVTGAPVPSGTRLRVRGWSGEIGPVELGGVAIFVAPDPESFRDLRGDPELGPAFIETISPTSGIVRSDAVDQLRRALDERGIATRPYVTPTGNSG